MSCRVTSNQPPLLGIIRWLAFLFSALTVVQESYYNVVQVIEFIYDGVEMLPEKHITSVEVVEHTKCMSQCKVVEVDCDPAIHTYGKISSAFQY